MKDIMVKILQFLMVILGILSLGLALWVAHKRDIEKQSKLISDNYERGYLDACKDFRRGKTKYDLVKNDDGTVEWKRVDK